MLRHRLKTGDLASRSERNAALIRTLSEVPPIDESNFLLLEYSFIYIFGSKFYFRLLFLQ